MIFADRTAFVSEFAKLGLGKNISRSSHISPKIRIGSGEIIGANPGMGHDNTVSPFVSMGSGVQFAPNCSIGVRRILGLGVVIMLRGSYSE